MNRQLGGEILQNDSRGRLRRIDDTGNTSARMRARTDEAPVLLLDDLLSELDAERRAHLLAVISRDDQQTLLTATGLEDFDATFLARARKVRVEAGRVYPS